MSEPFLIRARGIAKHFGQSRGFLTRQETVSAVCGVNLDVRRGETLGVVGESGCGKSTLGRICVGLMPPSQGEVLINGKSLYDRSAHADYRRFRRELAGHVQMIFQDPYLSLNPRMRIGDSVGEPLLCAGGARKNIAGRVAELLSQVGMDPEAGKRYPHEFSGGQRQRIAIARALATRPEFIVCDEPTSSLDASVQSQVLNLLRDMQAELGLTYMFISHDLAVVRHMSDRVAVMYRGFLVEEGDAEELFARPLHPYSRLLLDSVSGPGQDVPAGEKVSSSPPPSPAALSRIHRRETTESDMCPFVPRCPEAMPECNLKLPPAGRFEGRLVRCFLYPGDGL